MFAGDIASALMNADEVYLLPVYSAGEKELSHSSSDEIINLSGNRIMPLKFDDALETLKLKLKPDDLFLTMGAGDVYIIGEKILSE